MSDIMQELTLIIEAEVELHEKTIEKLQEQLEILVECALENLEVNLKKLDSLRAESKKLCEERVKAKKRLMRKTGLKNSQVTLAKLAAAEGGPYVKRLLTAKDRLVETAKKIRSQSRRNMILIRQSLELNSELLVQISRNHGKEVSTYDHSGEIIQTPNKGMVDAKG